MKVFISWSGGRSRALAEVVRDWLRLVLTPVRPFYSPEDVESGARLAVEIAKELEDAQFGILCLTKDNLDAPWIMFEAGSISKQVGRSSVCPILFEGDLMDLKGPLLQFNAMIFGREGMLKLLRSINTKLGDRALAADVLERTFVMWWPQLNEQIRSVISADKSSEKAPVRPEREILEEMLLLLRTLTRDRQALAVPERGESTLWLLLRRALESGRFLFTRHADGGTFDVLVRIDEEDIVADVNELERAVEALRELPLSPGAREILGKMQLNLYEVQRETAKYEARFRMPEGRPIS